MKITHVCSGRNLVVKNDKTLKLSINQSELSYFGVNKYIENDKGERNCFRVDRLED